MDKTGKCFYLFTTTQSMVLLICLFIKYRIDSNSMSGFFNTASSIKIYKRHNEYIRLVDSTLRRIKGLPPYDRKRYMHVYRMFVYDRNIDIALDKKNH